LLPYGLLLDFLVGGMHLPKSYNTAAFGNQMDLPVTGSAFLVVQEPGALGVAGAIAA
jgi:hypothetical protein